MSFSYCVLASGSSGNALWVKSGGVELLVDAGLSACRIQRELEALGTELRNVRAVICTHGHNDHVAGVATLARRFGVEVWATAGTARCLPAGTPGSLVRRLERAGTAAVGGFELTTVPTPHDAPGSVALGLSCAGATLAVMTDLGVSTPALLDLARHADALVLESNHDLEMLDNGPYPRRLKERIKSDRGHLSNEQAAAVLAAALTPALAHLTLAHLSEHNNTPALARRAAEAVLERAGARVVLAVARKDAAGRPVTIVPAVRQLALFQ